VIVNFSPLLFARPLHPPLSAVLALFYFYSLRAALCAAHSLLFDTLVFFNVPIFPVGLKKRSPHSLKKRSLSEFKF